MLPVSGVEVNNSVPGEGVHLRCYFFLALLKYKFFSVTSGLAPVSRQSGRMRTACNI